MCAATIDRFGTTVKPAGSEILDIDDTFCAAHGDQQLAFWNAHHDERGFASMHIYYVETGTSLAAILRPARTPKGHGGAHAHQARDQITAQKRRLAEHHDHVERRLLYHYGRVEAMEWAE